MVSLLKFLFITAFGLVVVLPLALVLAFFGLPALAILGIIALPLAAVLAIVGLPVLLLLLAGAAMVAVVFGVLSAVFSIGILLFKLVLFVAVPVLALTWLFTRLVHREPYAETRELA